MELNSISSGQLHPQNVNDKVKCGICREDVGKKVKVCKEGLHFEVVCEKCYENNSPDDLEVMANLFKAFGGYFGMIKDPKYSFYKELKALITSKNSHKIVPSQDIKKLHQALLHGVSPSQFQQGLKILSDK